MLRNGSIAPLEKIAEQGDTDIQTLLGEVYDPFPGRTSMRGAVKDMTEAKKWYERAALAGDDLACRRLIRIYATGKPSVDNYLKAGYYFLRWALPQFRL